MIGQRLGHYEITGSLGKGGMGEVWRARDTRLGREVAIKTLPTELAGDADRLARFEREAKLLATLNHAHIASIYGIDEHQGTRFLAMELIEGESLEQRLKEGALPVEEALRLALQIAQALEAAHEKGVVHRDLKPANVMIVRDVVKVLDFGLAKAFSGKPAEASPAHSPALSLAMTQQGIILGTAAYMSPEQASGQGTDQRADIWAFGVVLYEMLTGMPLFAGESVPHVLAEVLKSEPDWKRLPKSLHPRIKLLLERCLVKKPRNRYHSIADVRIDLEQVLADPRGIERRDEMHSAPRSLAAGLASGVALIAVGGAIAALAAWALRSEPETPRQVRRSNAIEVLTGATFPSISHDGSRVSYVAEDPKAIYVLDMDDFDARPIPGPTGIYGRVQCLSPDGSWSAFAVSEFEMRKVPVAGGNSVPLGSIGDQQLVAGCDWADDGFVYVPASNGIVRVREGGGIFEQVTTVDRAGVERIHLLAQLLPGGRELLYSVSAYVEGESRIYPVLFDLDTRQPTVLDGIAGAAQYLPTESDPALGHLVIGNARALFAAAFDVRRRRAGPAVVIDDGLLEFNAFSVAAVARDGTLAYMAGTEYRVALSVPSVVDADGAVERFPGAARSYFHVEVSSESNRAALSSLSAGTPASAIADIWIHDVDTDTSEPRRLTLPGSSASPLWMRDGERIVFTTAPDNEAAVASLQSIRADGSDTPRLLRDLQITDFAITSIAPDDSDLLGILYDSSNRGDIVALPLGDGSPGSLATETDLRRLWPSPANEQHATFSPDGRWIAFSSDRTGSDEIYVLRNSEGAIPIPVSTAGGQQPRWHPAGSALFYHDGTAMMSVAFDSTVTDTSPLGDTRRLFETTLYEYPYVGASFFSYDVMPDGERFLILRPPDATEVPVELRVIVNAIEELNAVAPLSALSP